MITQFLAKPFSDDWEADRLTLKPGVVPLITEEQIVAGLDHKTIKRWLWIWHDRDVYTPEDEIADKDGLRKAGERKFKHAHVMIEVKPKLPVSTIARWFGVPPNAVDIQRGRGAFLDGCEYLPHESPKAVAAGKTHYDYDELHGSPGFDFVKEIHDLQAHRLKYGRRAGDMSPADTMRMHVLHDGWTMYDCREDDPLTYASIRTSLPPLRLDYLLDSEPCPFRLTIYVDGPGGIGKSAFCQYLAEAFFPENKHPCFCIGNDSRVTFDGYDGQPTIIWDDMRVTDFIKQFGSNGTYKLLDPHPRKEAQQAKNSRVILTNSLNIINGVQPYSEFISGLAGTYTDRDGMHHEAEDANQAWRRFPMIICVHQDDFDILINEGFVNHDLSSVQTMMQYARVRGSMAKLMQRLDGVAKKEVIHHFTKPAIDAAYMITSSHEDKISDPAQLPAEFLDYGTVMTRDDIENELMAQIEAEQEQRLQALTDFAYWVWNAPTYFQYPSAAPCTSNLMPTFADYCAQHPDFADHPGKAEYEWAEGLDDISIDTAVHHFTQFYKESGERVRTYNNAMIKQVIKWAYFEN